MQAQALRVVLVSFLSISTVGVLEAQPLFPLGEEVVLPPPATCGHFDPRVAWTSGGGLLAVWDSGLAGIVARSSAAGHLDFGPEMPLSGDDLAPNYPAVAATAGGGFLASWVRGPFRDKEIVLRRFDRLGTPQTPTAVVTAHRHLWEGAEIGLQPGEEAVLAWAEHADGADPAAVKLRRYTLEVAPLDGELTVADAGGSFGSVELAVHADGTFLVAWDRFAGGVSDTREVFVQAFAPDGVPAAEIVPLTAPLYRWPTKIAAAALPEGGYLVGWTDPGDPPPDEDRILIQRLDPLGQPIDPPRRVDLPGAGTIFDGPTIGADGDGAVVGWVRQSANSHADAYGRRLDREGRPIGDELRINRTVAETFGDRHHLTNLELALAGGRLAAAWQIYQTVHIIPTPCDVGVSTVAQSFRTRAAPTDVPALSGLGLAVLALLLGAAGLRASHARSH